MAGGQRELLIRLGKLGLSVAADRTNEKPEQI
jgi:hypothetical protein